MALHDKEMMPDRLNEDPTSMWGLTGKEWFRLAIKCIGSGVLCGFILGIITASILVMCGACILGLLGGIGLMLSIAKFKISPSKVGKPAGYLDQKAKVNGLFTKMGFRKLKTIHRSGLWCHKK
jgi:conjugative transfer region protein (TIGR03750 family)